MTRFRRLMALSAIAALLAGCNGGFYYDRATGLRADNPQVLATFQRAKTECRGEIAQSRLAGSGLRDPMVEAGLSETAMHGCMSKRGYDVRP